MLQRNGLNRKKKKQGEREREKMKKTRQIPRKTPYFIHPLNIVSVDINDDLKVEDDQFKTKKNVCVSVRVLLGDNLSKRRAVKKITNVSTCKCLFILRNLNLFRCSL